MKEAIDHSPVDRRRSRRGVPLAPAARPSRPASPRHARRFPPPSVLNTLPTSELLLAAIHAPDRCAGVPGVFGSGGLDQPP